MSELTKYDAWLKNDGPAALVIRQWLMPVEGEDGVVFPATFAAGGELANGGYNIDGQGYNTNVRVLVSEEWAKRELSYNIDGPAAGKNVCLIDSVGSQANRIEPIFAREDYLGLVPKVTIKAGEKTVNLLEAGHRAGDAIVRCSSLATELQTAFKAVLNGDSEPLARIAPTSLVFGVWDSRDTQAKLPRLISSTIRAFDVQKLTRSAQYNPPLDYAQLDIFSEEEKKKAEGDQKSPLAKRGFVHVPATGSHGGVIAIGGIRRDATLSLAALRLLAARLPDRTEALKRYVLGLALTAFTFSPSGYLRQGCNLVINPNGKHEFTEVHADGRRVALTLPHPDALAYARKTAEAFGVGKDREAPFDKELAKKDVAGDDTKKGGKKKKGSGD